MPACMSSRANAIRAACRKEGSSPPTWTCSDQRGVCGGGPRLHTQTRCDPGKVNVTEGRSRWPSHRGAGALDRVTWRWSCRRRGGAQAGPRCAGAGGHGDALFSRVPAPADSRIGTVGRCAPVQRRLIWSLVHRTAIRGRRSTISMVEDVQPQASRVARRSAPPHRPRPGCRLTGSPGCWQIDIDVRAGHRPAQAR